jgi:hypothetical protein
MAGSGTEDDGARGVTTPHRPDVAGVTACRAPSAGTRQQ